MKVEKGDYAFYKSIGICPRCGKNPAEPNKVLCLECAGRENDNYHRKRKQGTYNKQVQDTNRKRILANERRNAGLCYRCGKHPVSDGGMCNHCKAKAKQYRDNRRRDIARSERPAYGRCYICGKPVSEGKSVCEKCYEVRLSTIPAMLSNPNKEYFRGLNNLILIKK